jgi:hypothetical protein
MGTPSSNTSTFGIAQAAHLGLVAGGIGLAGRHAGEVHPGDVAQQLVEGLRWGFLDLGAGDHGGVERHLLDARSLRLAEMVTASSSRGSALSAASAKGEFINAIAMASGRRVVFMPAPICSYWGFQLQDYWQDYRRDTATARCGISPHPCRSAAVKH